MTASALIEYQTAAGISPATGYYGPLTRAYMESGKTVASTPATTPTATSGATPLGRQLVGRYPQATSLLAQRGVTLSGCKSF